MLYQLSYFRKNRPTRSHPFPTLRRGSRLIAPTLMHGRRICPTRFALWEEMDSNHRRRTPADLQSAPFGHSGIFPICFPMRRPLFTTLPLLCAPSFLPRPLSASGIDFALLHSAGCPSSSRAARLSSRWRDSNPRPADYKSAALAN